jgi:hypothetical protein
MPNPREIGIALDTVLAAVTEGGTGNSGVERPEPSPHFLQKGTPETDGHLRRNTGNGSEWVRADFARKLERALVEARQQEQIHYDNLHEAQAGYAKAERAEKMLRHAAAKADQWRECAERLAEAVSDMQGAVLYVNLERAAQGVEAALAEFKRLNEGGK